MVLAKTIRDKLLAFSIRTKITVMVVGIVMLLGAGVTLQARARLSANLTRNLEERGLALGNDLAAHSTDLILTGNIFALYELIPGMLENNPDVRYVIVQDASGHVLVHSFPGNVPADLLGINPISSGERYHVQPLNSDEGRLRDMAVLIYGGKVGVAHVGMSEQRLQAEISVATRELLLMTMLTLLLGIAVSLALTNVLLRPVRDLVNAARAVARGDLSVHPPVLAADEIGELTATFSAMTADLSRSHDDLLQRVRELPALNAITTAINRTFPDRSGSDDRSSLANVLAAILDETLKITNCSVGWIVPTVGADGQLAFAAQRGLPQDFMKYEMSPDLPDCCCRKVMSMDGVASFPTICRDCSCIRRARAMGVNLCCHVSVPLQSEGCTLGVMNIASDYERGELALTEIALLASIGQQVGVAIGNARLWDTLMHKEALHGRLLQQVIAAQEQERKRIARELHDEAGSLLTALMVKLRSLQEMGDWPPEVNACIDEIKSLGCHIIDDLHRLAVELRPRALDQLGLCAALGQYVRDIGRQHGLIAEFQSIGLDGAQLAPEVETTLYRIVQEALTNAVRHATPKQIGVLLENRGDSIVAIVEDDGQGFDESQANGQTRLGLVGMQERAALVGGRLTIESHLGQGTTIFVEIPVNHRR